MRFRLRAQHGSPGTEFLDAETERQKPPPKGTNARRDKNRGIEWQKSPQKRPIWRRLRIMRFARAGWWRMQSSETGLRTENSRLLGNLIGKSVILGRFGTKREPEFYYLSASCGAIP